MKIIRRLLLSAYGVICYYFIKVYTDTLRRAKQADPYSLNLLFIILRGVAPIILFILIMIALFWGISHAISNFFLSVDRLVSQSGREGDTLFFAVIFVCISGFIYSISHVKIITSLTKLISYFLIALGVWSIAARISKAMPSSSEMQREHVLAFFNNFTKAEFLNGITQSDSLQLLIANNRGSLGLITVGIFLGLAGEISSSLDRDSSVIGRMKERLAESKRQRG